MSIPDQIVVDHPGIKTTLNKQLAKATSTHEAFVILNKQLKTYKNALVTIRQQLPENRFNYLGYFIGAPKEDRTLIVDIKGTRDIIDENIYKKYQLQLFFSDTIAVIDTLKLAIYPSDFNYSITNYYIITNNEAAKRKVRLPSESGNILMLCQTDFSKMQQPINCLLYNGDADKMITGFYLRFLGKEELKELYNIAQSLMEESGDDDKASKASIAAHLQKYIKARWGNMQSNTIYSWLEKTFRQ
jgi:hypothetical protein